MKDVCWIALDREMAEFIAENWQGTMDGGGNVYATLEQSAISDLCRKSLVTECVSVAGEIEVIAAGRPTEYIGISCDTDQAIEESIVAANIPTGPCRVIVIAGERDG